MDLFDHPFDDPDIACFPDIMPSEAGNMPCQDYFAIRPRCDQVKHIRGFIVMSGMSAAGPAWRAAVWLA